MNRAERERKAYDEDRIWELSHKWHARFPHVFESPNTMRHERLFASMLQTSVAGRRVLELGCGDGALSSTLLSLGAAYVHGVENSRIFFAKAAARTIPGRLEFTLHDVTQPVPDTFDAIVGRAIVHHVDYRDILPRLYHETLRPGGRMIFMEPLASNLLIRLFTALVPGAHTPDERSLNGDDIRWLRRTFAHFELHPFNFTSLPAGIVSSYTFSRADNWLLRWCDTVDTALASRAGWLAPHFRHAIMVIAKPT